jgi:hypothetical protein
MATVVAMSQQIIGSTAPSPGGVHPMARARPLMELTGVLLTVAGWGAQAGALISAKDNDLDAGDFFATVGAFQLFIAPLILIGVFLAIAPRIFFQWGESVSTMGPALAAVFGLVLAGSSVVFAAGATVTAIHRGSNEEFALGASEWVVAASVTVAAVAAVVLCVLGLMVASTPGRPRPKPQPIQFGG